MKRLLVVAVLLSAACGSQKPVGSPPPPGLVTLGTFTGEVDLLVGTFSVRSDQETGPSARTQAVIPESSTTVTIANSGASWNNAIRSGQCAGAPVTGANVVVTQRYPSPTFLGAVYAEITSVSATGVSACNSVVAPTGLGVSAEFGLWSHGSLAWNNDSGARTSATTEWNFTTASATRFTFSGRIVALRGTQIPVSGANTGYFGTLQDTGTRMVYGPNALSLTFLKYDGTSDGTSIAALPAGYATSLAVDSSRIWFGTYSAPTYVGYMNADGSGTSSSVETSAIRQIVRRIRIDPADATRAFFVDYVNVTQGYIKTVSVGTPPVVTTVAELSFIPRDFVFGSNGNLFIADTSGNAIREYTKAGVLLNTYSTAGTTCNGPSAITQTSDGTFWFTAQTSGYVCTLVPTGATDVATVTAQVACNTASDVVRDESDNVWATCTSAWTSYALLRMTPGSTARLTVEIPDYGLSQVATSSGLVWAQGVTYLTSAGMANAVYRMAY